MSGAPAAAASARTPSAMARIVARKGSRLGTRGEVID